MSDRFPIGVATTYNDPAPVAHGRRSRSSGSGVRAGVSLVSMGLRRLLLQGLLGALPAGFARAQTATTAPPPFSRIVYGTGATRVAVLLELNAGSYARASQAVLAGLRGALGRDGQGMSLEVFPLSESMDELDAALGAITQRRHAMVIGPLTRAGVDALSDRGALPVPVLALNQTDGQRIAPDNLIQFGLPIEGEARQVAQVAYDQSVQRMPDRRPPAALVLTSASPLARRSTGAFIDAWRELGGILTRPPLDTGAQSAAELRGAPGGLRADVVFAAVGADALRPLRSVFPPELPVYGTSQLNAVMPGALAGASELEGVRLLDMPWQLLPDHVAVMSYPRQRSLGHLDFQRLYALGIDAFRIGRELIGQNARFEVDGVTGWLRVDLSVANRRVERTAVLAEIRNGNAVAIGR